MSRHELLQAFARVARMLGEAETLIRTTRVDRDGLIIDLRDADRIDTLLHHIEREMAILRKGASGRPGAQ